VQEVKEPIDNHHWSSDAKCLVLRDLRPRGPADWWPALCSRAPPTSRAPTASAPLMAFATLDPGASTRERQALWAGGLPAHCCASHQSAGPLWGTVADERHEDETCSGSTRLHPKTSYGRDCNLC
jgi:hypothetical protein